MKTLLRSQHYYLQLSEVFKAEVDKHQGEERPPNTDQAAGKRDKSILPPSLPTLTPVPVQPRHEWLLANGSGGPVVYPGALKDHPISGDSTRGVLSTGS